MRAQSTTRNRRREAGIALLISIFILLLISVVAIALIVASGTESSLAGNYRSATGVYYAALAGLEEARGRLLTQDPNSFKNTAPNILPPPGTAFDIGYASYVLNPGPTDGNVLTTYRDTEYDSEFGPGALATVTGAGNINTTLSIWDSNPLKTSLNLPGPLYKWVRINAVSEKSLKLDVGPAYDGFLDPITPVFYDGAQLNVANSGSQVLEITALAVLPNGSQKLLQYLVAPTPFMFPAALTIAGTNVTYNGPNYNQFRVTGTDGYGNGSCSPLTGPPSPFAGIGYTANDSSQSNILSGIPLINTGKYTGSSGPPSVSSVAAALPTNLQTPSGLNALVQNITANADVVITAATANYGNLPAAMSPTNPMTVVINGSLDLDGWTGTGYGLLLVTGSFNYDPASSWKGLILVIGKGHVTGDRPGAGQITGAMFVARTLDSDGDLLPDPNLGHSSVDFNSVSTQGFGIHYSSCWIAASLSKASPGTDSSKILSFHEISQ